MKKELALPLQIYQGRRGLSLRKQWRWRIVAENGRVIADGGEGYTNRADLLHALSLVRKSLAAEVSKREKFVTKSPYEKPGVRDIVDPAEIEQIKALLRG